MRALGAADPDRLVVAGDDPLTYGELDRRADRVAQGLRERVGQGARVGLRMESFGPIVVAMLALRRAGVVSVPIDPRAPHDRVQAVLDDTDAALLIDDAPNNPGPPTWPTIGLADLEVEVGPSFEDHRYERSEPTSLLYTSGSTGVPKAIVCGPDRHTIQARFLHDDVPAELVRLGAMDVGSLGMALAIIDPALVRGATIIPYRILELGLGPMPDFLRDERVEMIFGPPTLFRFFLPTLPADVVFDDLRLVAFAGESVVLEDVQSVLPHLPRDAVVYDFYGASETGIISRARIDHTTDLGAGMPPHEVIDDVVVRIVDDRGATVPAGEPGEIVVQSTGVGLGYWRRPDLTAGTFERSGEQWACRSGDGGSLAPDGTLRVTGRLDHVVKVSGHRVDLQELESVLLDRPEVSAAVAVGFVDGHGDQRIAAFVVLEPDAAIGRTELRAALARKLPGYMLPARLAIRDELPQLSNGKVDRRRLTDEAEAPPAVVSSDEPRRLDADVATIVEEIWAAVLGIERVGPDDDFFELGGTSLQASQLLVDVEERLGMSRPVAVLLEASTLGAFTELLLAGPTDGDIVVPIQTDGSSPPVLAIHGGRADIMWARHVAEACGPDQPVYGVQPPMDLASAGVTNLDELCDLYVGATERVRPGSVCLFGFSYGGIVAYEMALRLQRAGVGPVGLVIGDTPLNLLQSELARQHLGRARRADLAGLPPHRKLLGLARLVAEDPKRVVDWARRRTATTTTFEAKRTATAEEDRVRLGRLLLDHRVGGVYEGSIVLVRSAENAALGDLGWSARCTGTVDVVDVGGTHGDIVQPPNVRGVAEAVRRAIVAADLGP